MCRFVAYHGPPICVADLITRPTHSIIHQSYRAKERVEPLNGDGFGLAWYAPSSEEPALFKDVSPAWNNLNLTDLARVIVSRTVLAHVRAATQGLSVMRSNCHPFAHGRFCFMHNGNVGAFDRIRRALLARLSDEAFSAIHGTTDSEHAFALWIDHWNALPELPALERMRVAMARTLESIEELTTDTGAPCSLNLAVSDGERLVASRVVLGDEPGNTLYWRAGVDLTCEGGVCSMKPGREDAVLVASEPLFEPHSWTPVPMQSLLTLEGAKVEVHPR